MESDDVKFSLSEITTTADKKTLSGEIEVKCGPCREGRHNGCETIDCDCRRRNHKQV